MGEEGMVKEVESGRKEETGKGGGPCPVDTEKYN